MCPNLETFLTFIEQSKFLFIDIVHEGSHKIVGRLSINLSFYQTNNEFKLPYFHNQSFIIYSTQDNAEIGSIIFSLTTNLLNESLPPPSSVVMTKNEKESLQFTESNLTTPKERENINHNMSKDTNQVNSSSPLSSPLVTPIHSSKLPIPVKKTNTSQILLNDKDMKQTQPSSHKIHTFELNKSSNNNRKKVIKDVQNVTKKGISQKEEKSYEKERVSLSSNDNSSLLKTILDKGKELKYKLNAAYVDTIHRSLNLEEEKEESHQNEVQSKELLNVIDESESDINEVLKDIIGTDSNLEFGGKK